MSTAMSANLAEKVEEKSKEGKLSCKEAFKLAESLGVSPSEVGKAANEKKIKIVGCQLGCFK